MKKYKVAVWEEMSGFINVEATSQEEAQELAEELINENGVEDLFLKGYALKAVLGASQTHGDRQVLSVEEINYDEEI